MNGSTSKSTSTSVAHKQLDFHHGNPLKHIQIQFNSTIRTWNPLPGSISFVCYSMERKELTWDNHGDVGLIQLKIDKFTTVDDDDDVDDDDVVDVYLS